MIVVGAVFVAVGIVLGTVFTLLGLKDYSAYTGRAGATVVSIDTRTDRSSSGKISTSRSYDVRFTVGDRTVTVADVGGVHSGDLATGDSVTVAFPPDQPELAVWSQTVEGGQRVLLSVGLGVGVIFGGLGLLIVTMGLRRASGGQPVAAGSGIVGPLTADPGPADEIGRTWTFDEVVADLARPEG